MITGVVLARNEEHNIVACLEALRPHVGELLLIDMDSTDRTVQRAAPFVDRVLPHDHTPRFDAARNVAVPVAKFDWLWFVDADERIPFGTGQLVNELVRTRGDQFEAINVPFKTYFCGRWMQHCGWWPGFTMPRVLKKGHFRFADKLHGGVQVDGREVRLVPDPNLAVDHFSYRSVDHYVEKFNQYTTVEAQSLAEQDATFRWQDGIREMVRDLWHYYENTRGRNDGIHGWVLSWLAGQYRWFSRAKLLDRSPRLEADNSASGPANLDEVVLLMEQELARCRAPRPQVPLGIVWRSPIWDPSGYSAEARTMIRALAAGSRFIAVEEIPWSDKTCELPADQVGLLKAACRARRPSSAVAITDCIPTICQPDSSAVLNVLRTTFETDRIPFHWINFLEAYDDIWVTSQACYRAFRRSWVAPEKLRVVPATVDTEFFSPQGRRMRLPKGLSGRFVFLSVFDWQIRKGWDVLLPAYCEAFSVDDGVGLLLKITRGHGHPMDMVVHQANAALESLNTSLSDRPDIVLWDQALTEAEMAALYRSVNAFVLASRGEGAGRPYLEAMASGLPTIGTDGTGNSDFMNNENSFLLPVTETEVSDAAAAEIPVFLGHRWGEPDREALRDTLRDVYSDKQRRQAVARNGMASVRREFGLERCRREVERAISELEERFKVADPPQSRADQIRVALEGELFARHSFSTINEVLARFFAADVTIDFSLRRTFISEIYDQAERPVAFPFAHVDRALPDQPHVTIRHAYPPNWSRPAGGKWVHIQPWEFGYLPQAWLQPLRDDVDEIWVPSEYVKQVYVDSGILPEKVYVIPWGIDPEVFCADIPALILPTEKAFRFLFVGGTIPRKGFDVALDAYLAEFGPDDDVCFVIKDVGAQTFYRGDNFRAKIRTAIESSAAPKVVYLDQHLTSGQLASLYRACDCFVAPYRGEGFGLPILEAMACGVPPIVPSGGPTDDFVTPDTGFILASEKVPCPHPWPLCGPGWELGVDIEELRRTMRRAYEDREQVREMAKRSSRSVREHFTWQRTYREMRGRIEVLVGSGAAPIATRSDESEPRGTKESPKLSLCMIVRDNAATLDACLSSISPWVDEIVVVDTGSVDETPAIAQRYGAKLFHFPWCDDFAAARNESLRHATGEWLFWMDSDDTIDAENGAKLRGLVMQESDPMTLGYVMQVHCPAANGDGNTDVTAVDHVKLVRNRPDLRFEGRIHEQLLMAIRRAGGDVEWTDIFVAHSGADRSPEGLRHKRERDLRLLQLELSERPEHPFTLFNLGMTYADVGDHVSAIDYLQRCLNVSKPEESHVRKAYALLVGSHAENGAHDLAWRVCDDGLKVCPRDVELLFRRGTLAHKLERLDEAIAAYSAILADSEPRHFSSVDRGIRGFKTRHNLAAVYADQQRWDLAEQTWRDALREAPEFRPALRGLVHCLLKQGKASEADAELHDFGEAPSLACEIHMARAEIALARHDVQAARRHAADAIADHPDDVDATQLWCRVCFEHGSAEDAVVALERLVALAPNDAAAWHNLGTAWLRLNRFTEALSAYERSLELRPGYALTAQHRDIARDALQADSHARQRQSIPAHPAV